MPLQDVEIKHVQAVHAVDIRLVLRKPVVVKHMFINVTVVVELKQQVARKVVQEE